MKILMIGSLYPPYAHGGAEKALATLAEALAQRGHNVVVVTLNAGVSEETEERNGVRLYRLPLDNLYWPFEPTKPNSWLRMLWHLREMWNAKATRRIGRILDLETPDVVHTHNLCGFSVAVWRAVKKRRIRLVHTLHDYYLLCPRQSLYRNGRACQNRCLDCRLLTVNRKAASRIPDEIVSVSQFTLDRHKSLGFLRGVSSRVIYNIQSAGEGRKPEVASRPKSDVLTFGFIGRIEPEKGLETLLQASQSLVSSSWRLTIAGKGTDAYVNYLQQEYQDERIGWHGYTPAAEFYSGVDVVVIPSRWDEPLGYVCIEGLHHGKPLICAQVGGLDEIARLSQVVGVFRAGDADELACLMNNALDNPSKWKRQLLPSPEVLELFTEQTVVRQYLQSYRAEQETLAVSLGRQVECEGAVR